MQNPKFKKSELVRRRSQPESVGIILGGYFEEATGQWIHKVQFGNATRGIADTELELLPEHTDAWDDIREGIYGNAEAFISLMTFERLHRPPSPIAASFGSAKAAFYPFQFKPLLKFLENPNKRLLIADDVGLGKTIEAGYIIRELKSRVSIERILLVVPSRLRTKWQAEMDRRFGEHFDIVTGRQIANLRQKMESIHELDPFSWIVSIESARSDEVVGFLDDLQPSMDIVVVDEAHRMRNSGTHQHRLGKALSACAEHMVMLTATPVQTGLDNLFRLLNILDGSEFQDAGLFEERCTANRTIVRAAAAIRSNPPNTKVALNALEEAKNYEYTRHLTQSSYYSNLVERCENAANLNREDLVTLQRDINELSLTGKIVSRTRKSEVIPDKTVRDAQTVKIQFTEAERNFYESVEHLCQVLSPGLSSWGHTLAALQWFRATASCIPAAARRFREKISEDRNFIGRIEGGFEKDDEGYINDTTSRKNADRLNRTEIIDEITDAISHLTKEDSKYEHLLTTLREIWQEESDEPLRKVVLFAYFKPTLAYLDERLQKDGIETRLITGDVPIPEREARIEEFSNDREIRVLLSSEVGSEGLDLQFASVIVNYDLPWNPMVVEQRIGRVDRIGQSAEKILIVNLVASETIEDRILLRLYKRIGIFKDTIGEIDPILGETVEKLASEALHGKLSAEEQKERSERSADAMVDQLQGAEILAGKTDSLMAADQSFLDEIDGLIGRKRIPTGNELYAYVRGFLTSRFDGCRFPESLVSNVAEISTPADAGRLVADSFKSDPEAVRFGRMLQSGPVKITFDQEAALKHASAELIHGRHPLVRTVTKARQDDGFWPRAFALRLGPEVLIGAAKGLSGDFAFEIHIFDTHGVRQRVTLVPLVIDGNHQLLDDEKAEDILLSLMQHARSLDPNPNLPPELTEQLAMDLQSFLSSRRSRTAAAELRLNEIQKERLRATLTVALDHRVNEAEKRLSNFEAKQAAPFAVRMAKARLDQARRERETRLNEIGHVSAPKLETELVAAGVLLIDPET